MAASLLSRADPTKVYEWFIPGTIDVPDIIEFVYSDRYLNRPNLYPRQATLLKVIANQEELFTSFDYDVIEEWSNDFHTPRQGPEILKYEGNHGIVPDVLERMEWLREREYPWFREVVAVVGRRGGKGHIGGIMGAYVMWNFLAKGNPQQSYGLDPGKSLGMMVFAPKKQKARDEQWKDINRLVLEAPCFGSYISRAQTESLSVFAPNDFLRALTLQERGVETSLDQATFNIIPKEATGDAGRGPTAFAIFFDEIAFATGTGINQSAEVVYDAATPALDQFKKDAFIYLSSSPWQQEGKFYEQYVNGLKLDPETMAPWDPRSLVVQLRSWDTYENWQDTKTGKMIVRPESKGKPTIYFSPLVQAMQEYDEGMKLLERSNPETFAVERLAHFARAQHAYLNPERIAEMFEPFLGERLYHTRRGPLSHAYAMHGDPGRINDRFGLAVGHKVWVPDEKHPPNPTNGGLRGMYHVVFDFIHAYDPKDEDWTSRNEDGTPRWQLDYTLVTQDLFEIIKGFWPEMVTFDPWNCVDEDTMVATTMGLVAIRDLVDPQGDMADGEQRQITAGVHARESVQHDIVGYRKGEAQTLWLRTKHGSVRCTPEHRVLIRRDGEELWLPAGEVVDGDEMMVRRYMTPAQHEVEIEETSTPGVSRLPSWRWQVAAGVDGKQNYLGSFDTKQEAWEVGRAWRRENQPRFYDLPLTLGPSLGEILGLLDAEGDVAKTGRFSINDRDVIDRYLDAVEEVFGRRPNVSVRYFESEEWEDNFVVMLPKKVADHLKRFGMVAGSRAKRMPWAILRSPVAVIRAYLRGLFEGDGHVARRDRQVYLTTTSEDMATEVQQALGACGILSHIWANTKKVEFRVFVSGLDLLIFADTIGFIGKRKQDSLDELVRAAIATPLFGVRHHNTDTSEGRWTKVEVSDGGVALCYDLSVPPEESFLANGLVVHNSGMSIDTLRLQVRADRNKPRSTMVDVINPNQNSNWETAEVFKSALYLNLLHAPVHEILDEEMAHLRMAGPKRVDHPSVGPVQTKDVWDAVAAVTHRLLAEQMATIGLSAVLPQASIQGGMPVAGASMEDQFRKLTGTGRGRRRISRG